MTKPLSQNLRVRVVDAVEGGMSRRAAAERFGITPSAAVKWLRLWRETGAVAPRAQGGDKRSERIEALADVISVMSMRRRTSPSWRSPSALRRSMGSALLRLRCIAFLPGAASRSKKDCARRRTGPPRRSAPPACLV